MLARFFYEEEGAMSLEAAIIVATLVALAIVFRKQLIKLWDKTGGEMAEMEQEISKK